MTLIEKMIATAFFKEYSLSFEYTKYDPDGNETSHESRTLTSISDIKYNDHSDILVCGCVDGSSFDYRKFFLDNMSNIQVYKRIDIAELDN